MNLRSLALLQVFLAFAWPASAFAAMPDGLAPCEVDQSYHAKVASAIDQAASARTLLGLTAYPSFESEWGIRILQNAKNQPMLRVVEFKKQVWSTMFHERPKGTFSRDPSRANLARHIKEIPISTELLQELRRVVDYEVRVASAGNAAIGFDGETYHFTSGEKACGSAWSPGDGTRNGELVAIFQSLRKLPDAPTLLRSLQEARITGRLRARLPTN
jgi:hypothetical protein